MGNIPDLVTLDKGQPELSQDSTTLIILAVTGLLEVTPRILGATGSWLGGCLHGRAVPLSLAEESERHTLVPIVL